MERLWNKSAPFFLYAIAAIQQLLSLSCVQVYNWAVAIETRIDSK